MTLGIVIVATYGIVWAAALRWTRDEDRILVLIMGALVFTMVATMAVIAAVG